MNKNKNKHSKKMKITEVASQNNKADLFHLIVDNITYLVFWKDKNLKFLGCNKAFADTIGLKDTNDVIGKKDEDLNYSKEDILEFESTDKLVLNHKKTINYRMKAVNKDGWLDVTKIPLRNRQGDVIGIVGVLMDITADVEAQEKIIKNSQKYKSLLEATQTAYVITDTEFKIIETNSVFDNLMKYTPEQIYGHNIRCLISAKDIQFFDNMFLKLLSGQFVNNLEIALLTSNKTEINVSITANMVENGESKIICVLRDITDKKREENKKFIRSQQQKDQLRQEIASVRDSLTRIIK